MRYYQSRQYDMLKQVEGFLNSRQKKIFAKVPALRDVVEDFMSRQAHLLDLYLVKSNSAKVNTLQKQSTRIEFINQLMKLIAVLRAHRFQKEDATVRQRKKVSDGASSEQFIQYSFSELSRMPAARLCNAAEKVLEDVKKIKNVDRYGVTPDEVREVQLYYNEFAAIKEAPMQRRRENAKRSSELVKGIKENIAILENRIDPLMRIAGAGSVDLTDGYKSARTVLPRAKGKPSDKEVKYRKSRMRKPSRKK